MWVNLLIFIFAGLNIGSTEDYDYLPETTTHSNMLAKGEKKISEYIVEALKRFQDPDPVGIPGADIPDPMPMPDTKKSFGFTSLLFKDTAVHGMSKFRIQYMKVEIASMKVTANMTIDHLEAKGNCVASTFWNSVHSPFTVKLAGINVTGLAALGVSRDGKLTAQDIEIDFSVKSISMNFDDAGALGFIISGFINTAGNFLFDSLKPHMLKEAYSNTKEEINKRIYEIAEDLQFPNTISPLDMIIIDARKKVRALKMDPYEIEDYNTTVGIFSVMLYNTWITGLSSFKRVGNISLTLEENTVIADFEIGTDQLEGTTQWEMSAVNGMLSRTGIASFSVKFINGRMILAQSLDTRKRPQLKDLNLEVGNLQIRSDGAGTLDYVTECAINILPNLLRYQIEEILENPLKWKIQKELNETNVEELIKNELPAIDEFQEKGFKLSALRDIKEDDEEQDDEFFNF